MKNVITITLMFAIVSLFSAATATATPLPGQILKFQQLPMDGTTIGGAAGTTQYWGHDELSTAYGAYDPTGQLTGYVGNFMADDFADRFETPVVHVRWWGSYLQQNTLQPVDEFLIAFESDIPDPDGPTGPGFSQPGTPLLTQIVRRVPVGPTPPGSFEEKWVSGGNPGQIEDLYEYNAELHLGKEFFQKPDTVYWLKIVALVDAGLNPDPATLTQWGWHNRDYTIMDPLASVPPVVVPGEHIQGAIADPGGTTANIWHFQDDAVTGLVQVTLNPDAPLMPDIEQIEIVPTHYVDLLDGPDGISQYSKDLAFELYTIPEPATVALLGLGMLCLGRRRRHRA